MGDRDTLLVSLYAPEWLATVPRCFFHMVFSFLLRRTRIGEFWKMALSNSALILQGTSSKFTASKFLATVSHMFQVSTTQYVQEKPEIAVWIQQWICDKWTTSSHLCSLWSWTGHGFCAEGSFATASSLVKKRETIPYRKQILQLIFFDCFSYFMGKSMQ